MWQDHDPSSSETADHTESVESNAESAETCHIKKRKLLSQMATSMLKAASDIYKMPLYRTAHSPENSSDEWAFFFLYIKYTFVVTQTNAVKSVGERVIFVCWRVSARFLHGFCTVSKRAEGAFCCKIRQRVQKLPGEKSRCFD